jgi:glycosyltransferase involved in cell wall biosynthesis
MLARFFTILLLSFKFVFWYLLLLFSGKQKKAVLLVPSFGDFGGTKTYFFYLIEFLYKKNYLIHVMLTKSQCDEDVMALQAQYPFTIHALNFQLSATQFEGTLFYKRNQEYFIYHLHELVFFCRQLKKYQCAQLIISEANPAVLLSLLALPVSVHYVLHTAAVNQLDALKRRLLNFSLSKTKQIITVSNYAKEQVLKNWTNGHHPEFVKRVYNFYEPGHQNIQQTSALTKKVLTIGTVAHYKNPFFWIDTCKEVLLKYPNEAIEFTWAGDGELLASCQELVKDIPCIQFISYQKNVEQLYLDCTLYFQPSILESHGIAVLGAMYFEKPCVVSNRQGLPESVLNNETGFIVSIEHPQDAVAAILYLFHNPAAAIEFGKAGKVRVETHFSKSKWETEMSDLLN